jgi:hypothetical protein
VRGDGIVYWESEIFWGNIRGLYEGGIPDNFISYLASSFDTVSKCQKFTVITSVVCPVKVDGNERFCVLKSNTIHCRNIFANRIESTGFITFLYKVN